MAGGGGRGGGWSFLRWEVKIRLLPGFILFDSVSLCISVDSTLCNRRLRALACLDCVGRVPSTDSAWMRIACVPLRTHPSVYPSCWSLINTQDVQHPVRGSCYCFLYLPFCFRICCACVRVCVCVACAQINSLMKDPVDEIAESNWDEMKALLTFLQHDGNLLHIPYPGSVFDDLYFFTPQWLFRSLLVRRCVIL